MKNEMKDNEKLKGLQNQMGEMHNDFEDMKRTREEAKKQLEAKFLDIYKKIQSMKDALDSEAKRVNDSLKAFQSKFEYMLSQFRDSIYKDFNDEKTYTRQTLEDHTNKLNLLEKMIINEREERMRQTDEQLNPIRTHLSNLQRDHDNDKAERLQHEKEIYRNISDNVFELNEKLNREKDERNTKIAILKEETTKDMKIRDKLFSDFQNNLHNDMQNLKDDLFGEMNNRFSHQNQIVDNLSNFLKTFQDTLKIVGKDV